MPFSALYWPLYESIKSMHAEQNSFYVTFVSGGVAGSVASTVTLPFDVVKTTKQIEFGEKNIMLVNSGQKVLIMLTSLTIMILNLILLKTINPDSNSINLDHHLLAVTS